MRVLITGAAGFIGSHLVERLALDHEVVALARHPLTTANVQWIAHDLTQPLPYADLPATIDTVIHLAQSQHYRDFPERAQDIYDVNIHSTFALLEYARKAGAQRFIFTSTGSVYQAKDRKDESIAENDPLNLSNFYAASKYAAEQLIVGYRTVFHTSICRLFFVYGARQNASMLIPRLVRSVYKGDPITLQGEDGISITPTHVDDVVQAINAMLTLEGHHVINVAGGEVLTLREVGAQIGAYFGRVPVFVADTKSKPSHLIADISKMRALLGEPLVPFASGVISVCRDAAL